MNLVSLPRGSQKIDALYAYAKAIKHTIVQWTPSGRQRSRRMMDFYSQFLSENLGTVFDIGANVGDRTEIFSNLGVRVVAVEPQSRLIPILEHRFSKNARVALVNKAVGAQLGEDTLHVCVEAPSIATMSQSWVAESRFSRQRKWRRKEVVQVTTLDRLISEHGMPSFCKIDVEGFEESVLAGLTKTIPSLSFELNYEFLDRAVNCIERLSTLGLYRYNYSVGESMEFLFQTWHVGDDLIRLLHELSPSVLYGDIYASISDVERPSAYPDGN